MVYPELDFRIGCQCPACELAVILWFCEDEHPARAAWQVFWDRVVDNKNDYPATIEGAPCQWQWGRLSRAYIAASQRARTYKGA